MSRQAPGPDTQGPTLSIRRHSAVTRVTHWINALCLAILFMSGLQIFNAHPALYWGDISTFDNPLALVGEFADWAIIPSHQDLAGGRHWHFFFAWLLVINGAIYVLSALLSRHLGRDLIPTRGQLGHIGRSISEHIRLRFPRGEEAKHYNVLQQLSYLIVIFVLLPLMILTGLSMSPQLNADFPWLPALFGGRQSARTVHFITAWSLFAFFAIHVAMVIVSGFWNNMRSMITGRYAIETGEADADTSKA